MTWQFVGLSLAMLAAASGFLVWPLWRAQAGVAKVSDGASAEGRLAQPRRKAAVGLVGALVLLSAGAYGVVGTPQSWLQPALLEPVARAPSVSDRADASLDGNDAQADAQAASSGRQGDGQAEGQAGIGQPQIEAMVQRLASRLQAQPDDAAGWRMLARSYETLRRFDDSVLAYQRLIALQKPDADLLVDYAVALGMSKGQTLAGEPEAVLDEALKQQPSHPQALALSGSAAFERRDYARAIERWQKLMTLIPAEQEMRASIQANIDKARKLSAAGR